MIIDADFVLGNMADDLVALTLKYCGKDDDKKLRFPKHLYSSYVNRLIDTALDVQEYIVIANALPLHDGSRTKYQQLAKGKLILLQHLIATAYRKGHISSKQHDSWQKLTTDVYWKLFHWMKV